MQFLFLPGCWQTLQSQAPTIHSQPMDCLMQILRATDSTVDPTKCHVTMSCLSKGFTVWNGLHKHRKRGRNLVSGKTSSQTQRFQKGLQRTPIQQEPNHEVSTSVMSWWHSNPICMFPLIKVISCRGKEIHRSSEYSHNKQRMRLQMSHTPLCCTNLVYPSCAVCRFDTFLHTGREPTARD